MNITHTSTILGIDRELGISEEVCVDRQQVSVKHSFIPGARKSDDSLRDDFWTRRLWSDLLLFMPTGYNVFTDSNKLSTRFQDKTACGGGTGSSIVFSPRTLSGSGCNNVPSDPLDLKTTCGGQAQAHQAVQLAFQDRSSFTVGFRVGCEGSQCGSKLLFEGAGPGIGVLVALRRRVLDEVQGPISVSIIVQSTSSLSPIRPTRTRSFYLTPVQRTQVKTTKKCYAP